MNFQEFKALTETGVSLAVATRDEELIPWIDDLAGIKLHADGSTLTCFMSSSNSSKALRNLEKHPEIAISISRPRDYFTAQIKGRVRQVRPIFPHEEIESKNWAELYKQEMLLVSVPPETIDCFEADADTALEITIEDIFTQTPGVRAGHRVKL